MGMTIGSQMDCSWVFTRRSKACIGIFVTLRFDQGLFGVHDFAACLVRESAAVYPAHTRHSGRVDMSGRARVPVGASGRAGLFGNPASARSGRSSEADVPPTKQKTTGRDVVPVAVSRQHNNNHQQADSTYTGAPPPPGRR